MLIQDIRPTISDSQQIKLNYLNIKALNIGIKPLKVKRAIEAQRIIDLRDKQYQFKQYDKNDAFDIQYPNAIPDTSNLTIISKNNATQSTLSNLNN